MANRLKGNWLKHALDQVWRPLSPPPSKALSNFKHLAAGVTAKLQPADSCSSHRETACLSGRMSVRPANLYFRLLATCLYTRNRAAAHVQTPFHDAWLWTTLSSLLALAISLTTHVSLLLLIAVICRRPHKTVFHHVRPTGNLFYFGLFTWWT